MSISISKPSLERWFHQYGSEAPAHIFELARRAWVALITDTRSAIMQRERDKDIAAFVSALHG